MHRPSLQVTRSQDLRGLPLPQLVDAPVSYVKEYVGLRKIEGESILITVTTEADTCRKYVTPALQAAVWDNPPHSIAEQRMFTDGRIVPVGDKIHRLQQKRADYLLRQNRPDFFAQYAHETQVILGELLDKYAEHGNVRRIAGYFGGPVQLRHTVRQLQTLLYTA